LAVHEAAAHFAHEQQLMHAPQCCDRPVCDAAPIIFPLGRPPAVGSPPLAVLGGRPGQRDQLIRVVRACAGISAQRAAALIVLQQGSAPHSHGGLGAALRLAAHPLGERRELPVVLELPRRHLSLLLLLPLRSLLLRLLLLRSLLLRSLLLPWLLLPFLLLPLLLLPLLLLPLQLLRLLLLRLLLLLLPGLPSLSLLLRLLLQLLLLVLPHGSERTAWRRQGLRLLHEVG
jgi:hypothetical protein